MLLPHNSCKVYATGEPHMYSHRQTLMHKAYAAASENHSMYVVACYRYIHRYVQKIEAA